MTDFASIPDRSNDDYNTIRAEWFQTIKSKLVAFETAPDFTEYASEAAYVTAKGAAVAEGDYFWDNVANALKVYDGSSWTTIATAADIAALQASLPTNNFSASVNPTAADDDTTYSVGSLWVNTTDDKSFIAVDVTTSAAIWKRLDTIMFKTVLTATLDFSSSNVGTGSYVEFVADTGSDVIRKIEFFYPDGDTMILAVGAAASEVDTAYVLAGGNELEVEIPANSRLSLKLETGGTVNTSGILAANLKAEA